MKERTASGQRQIGCAKRGQKARGGGSVIGGSGSHLTSSFFLLFSKTKATYCVGLQMCDGASRRNLRLSC
jgi:hypothetical protein